MTKNNSWLVYSLEDYKPLDFEIKDNSFGELVEYRPENTNGGLCPCKR